MKIAVIGGAGVRTVIFINGLLKRYRKLHIEEVRLFDLNQEKQEIIGKLCRHVVEREKEDLKVEVCGDCREAVRGVDYIVTTIRVGGDHSRVQDERAALSEGVLGQETTGAGGFAMAARAIPVLLDYCRIFRECAPDAWIFNFSNPSGMVTQALVSEGFDRVIGICDAPSATKFRMAQKLGVAEEDLSVEFFGLNHLSWIRSVKKQGVEILPQLLKDDVFLDSMQEFETFDHEVIRSSGFLPNEYLYYYYHREKAVANILASGSTRGETIEQVNRQMFAELSEMDIDQNPEEALQTFLYYMQVRENSYMSIESGISARPLLEKGNLPVPDGMGYAGVMLDCIEGMQSEQGKELVLCVKNKGSLKCVADEDIVEVTCRVSRDGIVPVTFGEIPPYCENLIRTIKAYEKCSVEAIKTQDREKAVWALAMNPLVNSWSIAKKLEEKFYQDRCGQ